MLHPSLLLPLIAIVLASCASGAGAPAIQFFQDCDDCPTMVTVPAGSFVMGTPPSEDGLKAEQPQHEVTVKQPFAVSRFEITFDQWDLCAGDGACASDIDDEGWGRGQRPVMNLTFDQASDYVAWLSKRTNQSYRLLSEAEWEYAARAGSQTRYPWGDEMIAGKAKCRACLNENDERQSAIVGSFPPNAFGLYDMHGNVSEFVADCWNGSYEGAPADGSAWQTGDCETRILRGGAWRSIPWVLRSGARFRRAADDATDISGFRVARSIP